MPRHLDEVTWQEIALHPVLLPAPQTAMRRIVDQVLRENGLETTSRYRFIQAETIIAMAEAGLGIAIQPGTTLEKQPPVHARVMTPTRAAKGVRSALAGCWTLADKANVGPFWIIASSIGSLLRSEASNAKSWPRHCPTGPVTPIANSGPRRFLS